MTDKAHRFPCPGCAADLEFAPKDGCLVCPYCGRREVIPQSAAEVAEQSYEEYLARPAALLPLAEGALEVACQGCGATLTFTPPQVSARCPFCGRQRVAATKSADPSIAPQAIQPFKKTRPEAVDAVRGWLGSVWLAPNGLKEMARHESLVGVYLPFWSFDAHSTTHYDGRRGTYRYRTESYTENGVRKTRQVRYTDWSPVSGTVAVWHDDVLVPATEAVRADRLRALAPWGLEELEPYNPAYLAGHEAQRHQIALGAAFEHGKAFMKEAIEVEVTADIGGDAQSIEHMAVSYSAVTFKHFLLPVYIAAYSYGGKVYQVLVNARTGQVQGDRPWSLWKIAFLALAVLLFLTLVLYVQAD